MSFSTFSTVSLITVLTLFIIVKCWKVIFLIGYSLYILGQVLFWSLMTTIIWHALIINNIDGWGWTWLYLILLFNGIIVAYVIIAFEIIDIAIDWVGYLVKRIKN